jgi:hypothetical protein
MTHNAIKSDDGKHLYALEVYEWDGFKHSFSALDIAYTISQGYKEVLVGDCAYLTNSFPDTCVPLQLTGEDNPFDSLNKMGVDFYFNADGTFAFKGDTAPNPDKAIDEFMLFFKAQNVALGPDYAIMEVKATELIVKKELGNRIKLFMYTDENC